MTRRIFNRNTFSEETPILDTKPMKNYSMTESRTMMQMILEIKLQAELEARSLQKNQTKQTKRTKPENYFLKIEDGSNQESHDSRKWFVPKNVQLKGRKLIEKVIRDEFDENEATIYPNLLETLIRKLTFSAQGLKRNLKQIKGLNVDEEFVLVNIHVCEYCGRKFSKPCALGGHISKLHSQDRRRELKKEQNVGQGVQKESGK